MMLVFTSFLLLCLFSTTIYAQPTADVLLVPTGWAASQLCSGLFVSGLPEETVIKEDVDIARLVADFKIDYERKTVTAYYKNQGEGQYVYTAIYRPGVGCTIVSGLTEEELREQEVGDLTEIPPLNETLPWPYGDYVNPNEEPDGVDMDTLRSVVNKDFRDIIANTRAILVIYKGKIILEQYAKGITKDTQMIGWSMTKSVTSAMIGLLVGEGRLSVKDKAPVKEWAETGDSRQNITIENLLHMSSGLRWGEGVDIVRCIWASDGDCAHFAASRNHRSDPDTEFEYSTGTTTILARTVMEQRGNPELTNFQYYRKRLFEKLGIRTGLVEFHPAQYPLGGSNGFLTARDWARFGQLYMQDGVWNGERILPEGWVDYTRTPSNAHGGYGAQWWLRNHPVPDLFYMSGFRNQNVFNMPSKELTVVRLSMPSLLLQTRWSQDEFLEQIVACFP